MKNWRNENRKCIYMYISLIQVENRKPDLKKKKKIAFTCALIL